MTPPFDRPALEARLANWEATENRPPDDGCKCHYHTLIRHAPADLRACLAEIDRLTKENEDLRARASGAEGVVIDVGLKLIGTGHEQLPITDAVSAVLGDLDRLQAEITRLRIEAIANQELLSRRER